MHYPELANAVFAHPAIDNHAHPLLKENVRNLLPLEGIISEAGGDALKRDSRYTLASYRATVQLSKLFKLKDGEPTWDALKIKRADTDYVDLCNMCFKPTGIQCILLDDGLDDVDTLAESVEWHDQFTTSPSKRIVRIEAEAEVMSSSVSTPPILDFGRKDIVRTMLGNDSANLSTSSVSIVSVLEELTERFKASILAHAQDQHVAGFKSVICYRTGLDIAPSSTYEEIQDAVLDLVLQYKATEGLCLQQKVLNDHLVRLVLQIAGKYNKPVQFHTGLGDNDIRLAKSSPAYMQPIIEAYPNTPIVLLHSSYPYTREAGYLTSVYKNVYLDFGEVFPLLSGDGQRAVVRQLLELAPTNKILWSTDGHRWPESYYLASIQSRRVLFEVFADFVHREELTEQQSVEIVQKALFHNANEIYNLGLEPNMSLL
ncbi:amidohydrolase 2 [Boletus coccyginus]|nr:amidohydrolase 2 [Boletus coccyginus]